MRIAYVQLATKRPISSLSGAYVSDGIEACEWEAIVGFIDTPLPWPLLGYAGLNLFRFRLVSAARAGRANAACASGHPGHEPRQITIVLRPEQQMPVVGHQAIGQQSHQDALDAFFQNPLEGLVISGLLDRQPRVGTVEHMINQSALGGSWRSSHRCKLSNPRLAVTIRFLTPFPRFSATRQDRVGGGIRNGSHVHAFVT
jgi:hypothetical protein